MTLEKFSSEVFDNVAEDTVNRYLQEIAAKTGKMSFEDMYDKAKVLNAELTIKAINMLKTRQPKHMNATMGLVEKYHDIIAASMQRFVQSL